MDPDPSQAILINGYYWYVADVGDTLDRHSSSLIVDHRIASNPVV